MSAVRSLTFPLPLLWTGDVPVVTTPDHLLPPDAQGSSAAQYSPVRDESVEPFSAPLVEAYAVP